MEKDIEGSEPEIDKSEWGPGPWQDEPDRLEWMSYGYPCLILRNYKLGNLCGYVGIPKEHPLFMKNCDALSVHGGVTFVDAIPKEKSAACWVGFDCAHANDLIPNFNGLSKKLNINLGFFGGSSKYRDANYVIEQVNDLAGQLRDRAGNAPRHPTC